MQQLRSGDGEITGVRVGDGPDLVVIHSLLADRTAFDAVLPRLAQSYRVTLINLPGFAGSKPVEGTVEAYVAALRKAFDAFGLAGDVTLMGNGFGGTLALAFALDHQSLLRKLVLVDVAPGFPEPGKQAFRGMADMVHKGGMAAIAPIAAARVYHDAFIREHPGEVEVRRAVLMKIDPAAFMAACETLVACDLTPRLGSIEIPTLVMFGELDQATPPALNQLIARSIANSVTCAISDCGHCPPLERPAEFLAAVGGFLGWAAGEP